MGPPMLATESIFEAQRALVKTAEAERAKVDVPLAVVDLDEANHLPAERLTDVDPRRVPADAAVVAHAPDRVVAGIVERRHAARVGPWRGGVDRGRGRIAERFVRAQGVDLGAPRVKAPLLDPETWSECHPCP